VGLGDCHCLAVRRSAFPLVALSAAGLLTACGSSSPAITVSKVAIGSTYQTVFMKVGHTRTYDFLQRRDQIFCLGGRHSVEVDVPARRAAAAFQQETVSTTRRLALSVGWRHGSVWALCRWR